MKSNLLFFLLSVVVVVNATNHTTDANTTTVAATTNQDTDIAAEGGATGAIDAAVDLIENATLTLKGSYNGTDSADQGFEYNYKHGGSDWPLLKSKHGVKNNCGVEGNQSPINLLQPIWSYGWAYGDTIPKMNDAHETTYRDLRKGVQVAWPKNINSLQVKLQEIESLENFFESNIAESYFKAATNKFAAESFFLRSPSEHTLMGKHFDIELQIKHTATAWNDTEKIKYAYVSIFFSVEHYDKSITEGQNSTVQRFFEHMKFDDMGEPEVEQIGLGQLLNIVDFEDRWVYKGTETFPPCEGYVYWNIPRRIFPIKIEEFARFKKLMDTQETKWHAKGNNRSLQKITNQNIRYLGALSLSATFSVVLSCIMSFY